MAINNLINKDISSSQHDNLYSFNYQTKNHDYVCDSSDEKEKVEPFSCEKDALDFANYYSLKVLDGAR